MIIKHYLGGIMLLLASLFVKGQESPESKFFVKVIGGYAFLAPGSLTTVNTFRQGMFEESRQKFGQGLRVGLGAGYILNDNINLGIDVIYHKGAKLDLTKTVDNQTDVFTPTNSTVEYLKITNVASSTIFNYNILNIVPHITFRAISKPNYHIYNRVGLIIGLPLKFNHIFHESSSVQIQNRKSPASYDITEFYDLTHYGNFAKNPSIGFQAALGVQFRLTKNLRFLTEIEASSFVLTPHELVYATFENITTTVDNVAKKTVQVSSDKRPRYIHYEKKGQTRTDENEKSVDMYQTRAKYTTNSLSLNLGFALRL